MDVPNIMSHVSIGSNDLDAALGFYDAVLATIGAERKLELPGVAVAYGKAYPEFWVQKPIDGQSAKSANGVHFGFIAPTRGAVDAFYAAALAAGGTGNGAPGLRPEYGNDYYGCFVLDLDGHKIEAATIPGAD